MSVLPWNRKQVDFTSLRIRRYNNSLVFYASTLIGNTSENTNAFMSAQECNICGRAEDVGGLT